MNVSSTASPRMLSRLVAALAGLMMFGAGCGQQKVPSQAVDKQALEADSLHMAQLYAQWDQDVRAQAGKDGKRRGEMPIDLADDAQYRFLKNRLLASGSSPENSPQLFERIEKLRKEKKAAIPGKATRKDMITSTTSISAARENPWCGHLLPLDDVEGTEAEKARFQTFGLVTCFNGSDYAFADVNAYVANAERTQFRAVGTQSLEDYAGAVLETPKLDVDVKPSPEELLIVDSVAIAFNEATGESHLSYAVAESSLMSLGMQTEDPDINTILSEHPRELIGKHYQDNPIRTCLERGALTGYLDCDYASGNLDPATGKFTPFARPYTGISAVDPEAVPTTSSPWVGKRADYWPAPNGTYDISRLYLPMRGQYRVKLPQNCTLESVESDASLILLQSGGRCAAGKAPGTEVLNGSLPFQPARPDGYYRTHMVAPYDGIADFGKDCLDNQQNVRLYMRATLKASCYININLAYTKVPYVRSRFHNIMNLDFRNACLAEGTKVTKADGQSVSVEQVKVGDKLLANGNGLALTVTTVSRGGERKPLVKLVDEQGGEVKVTETHPMVTAKRGVVQAGDLKAGDTLLTRTGATKLVGVERVAYSGDVFNFALGTPEELAKAGPEARTLYANGFLVGDSHLQTELEKARKLDAREVLSKLHGAWHEDFRRDQARQKSAQR